MRDPAAPNPLPRGAAARRAAGGERGRLLAHLGKPKQRSGLRVREPRRLPRGLDRAETAALLGSFRTDRDRAIAGLMLFCGLRSAEVLGLAVAAVDIPRGWIRVMGKGGKERRVPLEPDVAGLVQAYLLAGRPETSSRALFVVAKGPRRGQPLTPAGLRTIFRYHRAGPGCRPGTRTRCGTPSAPPWPRPTWPCCRRCWATTTWTPPPPTSNLAPAHVRAAYDAARQRQRE